MKFSYIYQYSPPFHFFAPRLSVLPRCHFYVVPRPMFRASGSVKHLLTRAFLHQTSWEELKSSSCSAKRQLVGRCFSWRKLAEDPSTLVSSAQLLAVAICFFGNTDLINKNPLLVMESAKTTQQFMEHFPHLLEALKTSPTLEALPEMRDWISKVVEFNVQGGKMNRGIALVETFKFLNNFHTSDEDLKIAITLGWSIELVIKTVFSSLIHT